MGLSYRTKLLINLTLIGISLITWVLLLMNPGQIMTIEHCTIPICGPSATPLELLLEENPFSNQLLGWGLMVIAMMFPKLIIPVQFIQMRSLKRFRVLFSVLFVVGYLSVWMIAGVFMTAAIIGLNLLMPMSFVPAIVVSIIALIWQFSPTKQRFLNLGHDHWNLVVFGWPAVRNVFHFGIMHGVWCVGAGWALMLFPMLLPEGHNLAMILVTFIMISEHLEHPDSPRWRINFRLKLLRIVVAQVKYKLMSLTS